MSNRYYDRGIIKWAPFDGLSSFHDLFAELKYRLGKKEKPILMVDQADEINYQIQIAIHDRKEIAFVYYEDGYFKNNIGFIDKIDDISQSIYISSHKYSLSAILSLKVLDLSLD